MTKPFYEQPILNSPYHPPTRHHALSEDGQPLDQPPINGRRRSKYVTPVPKARKQRRKGAAAGQTTLGFDVPEGDGAAKGYDPSPIINEIRGHLETWRALPNPNDWGVTPSTARLLSHWRTYQFEGIRPFFCQIEAVETIIWLTEVARGRRQYAHIFNHLKASNEQANPELFRLAMKMATGSGKTTVMAMLIAWHTVNVVRSPNSNLFAKGFLIVTPGITIRDRLRVLLPSDPDNYYDTRDLVPPDVLGEIGKARVAIVNYHVFKRREQLDTNKVGRATLSGWRNEPLMTLETEGEMLQRACGDLLQMRNVVVINDEAHHCYRERPETDEEAELKGDERAEAKENNEAARLWISGIEALKRKVGLRGVYDLSATPFFLRGSGYGEGTLFPWTISDFALIDAIECGIVKLPRVPVSDNLVNAPTPVFRNLWDYIGKRMPKKGAGKSGDLDPRSIPAELQTALYSLYGHYEEEFEDWKHAGIPVPPVFIVVCNNTGTSKLVHEWIAGWEREIDGEKQTIHHGHLELFQNYDQQGNPLPRMRTLLIDSVQIDSGEALDPNFRKMAAPEIDQFRREKAQREGAASSAALSDADLLREVMNTVGKEGRLGEQIRCVVSVSMLTEGWDTNTVTHILGVRAFGTQLLCEQVVGRGLRRLAYDLNADGLFNVEYADILGIPFDFATEPVRVKKTPPKPVIQVRTLKDRAHLAIRFPRVAGYRTELPDERFSARFTEDSKYRLTPEEVGPCTARLEGVVGEGIDISPDVLDAKRPNEVAFHLSKRLVELYFRDGDAAPPYHLVGKLQPITRRWIGECLTLVGGTRSGMLTYAEIAEKACGLIYAAIAREGEDRGASIVKAMLDPYNPVGSSDHVYFLTSKETLWTTRPDKCQVNYVVCDSDWEAEFARVVEAHPATLAYVKNQALGFEVPYRDGSTPRRYLPDFIVKLDPGSVAGAGDGRGADDPLHLVIEIKGFRDIAAQLKAETMRSQWVPGVNNLKTHGRWEFAELRDAFAIEEEYGTLVEQFLQQTYA